MATRAIRPRYLPLLLVGLACAGPALGEAARGGPAPRAGAAAGTAAKDQVGDRAARDVADRAARDVSDRAARDVADRAAREAIVTRLLELGSARTHVDNWRRMLADQATSVGAELDSATRDRVRGAWRAAVSASFDVDRVTSGWRQRLTDATTLSDLKVQLAFETGTLGQRLNAIASAAAAEHPTPDVSARRLIAAQQALARDPARARLLGRVLAAAEIETTTLEVLSSLQVATAVGAMEATPAGKRRTDMADVAELSERYRAVLKAQLAQTLMASYADMWSGLSAAELEAYARHLEQPATKRVVRASSAIYNDLMRSTALAIGRSFSQEMHAEQL